MIGVALKGLAGRKIRALLTAFAVVIGVSMVSGTFILTDTMQKTFDGLFTASSAQTDAVIQGKKIVDFSSSGAATVPESLLAKVRALPEVGAASGAVSPEASHVADILDSKGKAVGLESIGGSYDPAGAQFSPLKLKTGAWANGPEQVVIDAGTAEKEHYAIGAPVVISTLGEKHTYEVTGTASFGATDSLGFATIAAWDTKTAQQLLHREGRFDTISIAAKEGTSPAELVTAVKPLLSDTLEVQDSAAQSKEDAKDLNSGLDFLRYILLGFAGIALLVGAFVIFNTLSITVAQRTREFATLRTLGGSRKQVMRSVVAEGFAIGVLASVLGLVAGIGLAKGMFSLFAALGLELPDASTVVQPRTIVLSIVVGTVVTLVASILPARRATRVPPIAAVREGSTLPPSRLAAHSLKAGLVVAGVSVASVLAGLFGGLSGAGTALTLGGGVLGLFAGMALLAPRLVAPLARIVGWPGRRIGGVAGELAGANAVRNPGRTASTAAALMIGLTLVTLVAVLASSLTQGTQDGVKKAVHADYVVGGKDGSMFRSAEGDKLELIDGVDSTSHVRSDTVIAGGKEQVVTGIDPATIGRFFAFKWTKGSLEGLGDDGAIVSEQYAKAKHLTVGDTIAVTAPSGDKAKLVVRGIHDPKAELLKDISISQTAFDALTPQPRNAMTFLDADDAAGRQIKSAVNGYGDATFHTGAGFAKASTKDMATMLAMLYVLLGFSVLVSLFGMVNTLVLSVFERTREIGMLRTIGMTRRQARKMIRHESIITALIGAALGLGVGTSLAALVMAKWHLPVAIPVQTLLAFTMIAVVAGIGAAVMPARRASRLNVLEALHYE